MKNCAYCGNKGPLTKEHIYPKCLYERTPEQNCSYLEINGTPKRIEGDITVKDVCSACNNGFLSELDNYFCGLFDKYFFKFVEANESILFEYDFDKFARWLLKVAYNSARSFNSVNQAMLEAKPYIRFGKPRPSGLSIFVQLIIPYELDAAVVNELATKGKSLTKVYPSFTRNGPIRIKNFEDEYGLARVFSINSYYFCTLLPASDNQLRKCWSKALQRFQDAVPEAQWLHHNKRKIQLKTSNVDTLTANKSALYRFR